MSHHLHEEEIVSYDHQDDEDDQYSAPTRNSVSSITKEKFIEILSRDEDEAEEIHHQDYSYVLSSLVITTEPTLAKLACQAIDKVLLMKLTSSSSVLR